MKKSPKAVATSKKSSPAADDINVSIPQNKAAGAAAGAVAGGMIAGPVGAIAGGIVGALVAGNTDKVQDAVVSGAGALARKSPSARAVKKAVVSAGKETAKALTGAKTAVTKAVKSTGVKVKAPALKSPVKVVPKAKPVPAKPAATAPAKKTPAKAAPKSSKPVKAVKRSAPAKGRK